LVVLTSCKKCKVNTGIVFTFDDDAINEWYEQRSLFNNYNIHATFFFFFPHLLDSNLIYKLKVLESDGHEIACHGYEHKNATEYKAPEDYINQQVKPALQTLQGNGFHVTSFAYPFGDSTSVLDSMLLHFFLTIRKATYNTQNTTIDQYPEIYANQNTFRIVNAMGIDYNYGISLENYKTGIQRILKNKNEILVLHAHIIDSSNEDYTIHPEYLENLFLICRENNIKSLTMREMYNYFQKYK
jgi:peptidoglycan/xylan/chitin deacetylase (PgdA/CDA1 family)